MHIIPKNSLVVCEMWQWRFPIELLLLAYDFCFNAIKQCYIIVRMWLISINVTSFYLQEQKKKHSKKQWDTRIKNVEQKKEERQKKRKENIAKKKKEKKSKIVKQSVKRGRVVIS